MATKIKALDDVSDRPRQKELKLMESYHKDNRKRDKFDYAIMGIFLCSIIVSFNHTIELYKSAGFYEPIGWMNNHWTERWFGKDFFTLALFATLAAEAAFSVGLWGLYDAFRTERKLPGWRYKWTWGMFIGGLVIVGWSNIGGTLGYNYLFGNPIKGLVLGLSVPYFVLNAVLVNFSRSQSDEVIEHRTTEQPKWKQLINMYKEIKAELSEQIKQTEPITGYEQAEQIRLEQSEQTTSEQANPKEIEQPDTEEKQSIGIEQTQHPNIEQQNTEQQVLEQNKTIKKPNNKKNRTPLYVVKSNRTSKTEQAYQYVMELIEQNKEFTVRSVAEAVGCAPSTAQAAINRAKAGIRS